MEENEILSEKILGPVAEASRLSVFVASRGQRYSGALMVVGRAVNGWKEISPTETTAVRQRSQRSPERSVSDAVGSR